MEDIYVWRTPKHCFTSTAMRTYIKQGKGTSRLGLISNHQNLKQEKEKYRRLELVIIRR